MIDNQQLPPNANDGTIDGAVAAMGDIGGDDLVSFEERQNADAGLPPPQRNQQGRDRDTETGRFKKAEDEARAKDQKAAASETKNGADTTVEEAQDQDAGAVDEEYFELAPEKDGEEPKRIKASDVWAGYQEAEALRTELANAKRVAPPPIEWDQQMYETVKVRGQIINQFNQWMAANMPAEPDMRLIDPSNPNYNPDLYHLQLTQHRQQMQRIDNISAQRQALEDQQQREQETLLRARQIREQGKLHEFWPEIKNPAVQRKVRDDAARYYGITDEDFANTYESKVYRVLKDALAYQEGLNQRQAAVKVVRSVPKLVKAQARSTVSRNQTTVNKAMQRLARSGSIEDAADAIGGLL